MRLSRPVQGSSVPLRAHLEQIFKATGVKPDELKEAPECPEELLYLWYWYIDMHQPEKLSFTEIKNWCDLTGHKLTPDEVRIIRQIDNLRFKVKSNG